MPGDAIRCGFAGPGFQLSIVMNTIVQTGQIQKWVRRVLKHLGDDGKKDDSASKTLFESVWPTVLKWFRLALEKIRSAVSRANPKGQDIFKTVQGFTGRDNGTFLQDMATLDGKKRTGGKAAVGMDGPAPKRTKTKNQPAARNSQPQACPPARRALPRTTPPTRPSRPGRSGRENL